MGTKSSVTPVPIRAYQTVSFGGDPDVIISDYRASVNSGWTKVGTSNPRYRDVIESGGGNATSNYAVNSTYWKFENYGEFAYKHVEWPQWPDLDHARIDVRKVWNFCDFNDPGDPSGLSASNADSDARVDFLNKIRDQQIAFRSGAFFGEIRETIEMIRHPAEALRHGISDYVKAAKKAASRYKTVAKKNKAISGTYLEYQFGWRPLAHDIQDAAKAFDQPGGDGAKRVHVTGYGHSYSNSNVSRVRNDCIPSLAWVEQTIASVTVKYSGAVWIPPSKHPELTHWGVDATDFIPTVWELIPYSFLVDYFTNIGKVIDAVSMKDFSVVYACRNVRKKYDRRVTSFKAFNNGFQDAAHTLYVYGSDGGSFIVRENFTRDDKFADIRGSYLDIHFRIPGVESPWKWLNIGALASQRR